MTPRIPEVVHVRAELHRQPDGEWRKVHLCGVLYERGVTREPRVSNWDPATLRMLPRIEENCPDCIAVAERHSAACAAVRFGRDAA